MSTKHTSVDQALDFLPAAKKGPGLFARLSRMLAGINEGLEAQADYKKLTSHGVQPAEAAREVFDRHFDKAA